MREYQVDQSHDSENKKFTIKDVIQYKNERFDIEIHYDVKQESLWIGIVDGDQLCFDDYSQFKSVWDYMRLFDLVKETVETDDDARIHNFCTYMYETFDDEIKRTYIDEHFRTVVFVSMTDREHEFDLAEIDEF